MRRVAQVHGIRTTPVLGDALLHIDRDLQVMLSKSRSNDIYRYAPGSNERPACIDAGNFAPLAARLVAVPEYESSGGGREPVPARPIEAVPDHARTPCEKSFPREGSARSPGARLVVDYQAMQ
jgi:hypothetical protein